MEISEQLSRFCSGLNAVHSDYVGVYRPYKQREAREREEKLAAAIADARDEHNRRLLQAPLDEAVKVADASACSAQ